MKLYICGNGFDLHHNLPTSYGHYKKYLQEKYPDIFKDYEYFQFLSINNDSDKWSDIESALCIDYEELFNYYVCENYPDLSSDSDSRWCEMEVNIEVLTRFINDFTGRCFFEWIYKANEVETIADLDLDKDSLFINFNYTNTLQRLYNITDSSILHIHGSLKNIDVNDILWKNVCSDCSTMEEIEAYGILIDGDKWSNDYIREELQFGATGITAEQVKRDLISHYEDDDFYGVSIEPAIEKLVDFVKKSTKNIKNNYEDLKNFLSGKDIHEIIIMGVSLSDADDAYYSDILVPQFKNIKWVFMLHGDNLDKIEKFIYRHGLIYTNIIEW